MSAESKIIILDQGLVDGRGVRIAEAPTTDDLRILFGQSLQADRQSDLFETLPGPVYLAGMCSSSFDLAHELIRRDRFPDWAAVLVTGQTAGRGQLRRPWTSQSGNLFVSYRLPDLNCADSAVPVVVGLLWAQALNSFGYSLQLKWPNDLLQTGAGGPEKVGGILIEERGGVSVAGVGLNIRHMPTLAQMREEHAIPGGLLLEPDRLFADDLMAFYAEKQGIAHFWTKLAAAMFSCYFYKSGNNLNNEMDNDSNWWLPLAEGILAWFGRPVEIVDHNFGQSMRGVVAGLHHDGSLLLNTGLLDIGLLNSDGGIISISGGSLRPLGAV